MLTSEKAYGLLWGLLLMCYLRICDSIPIENERIDNVTRPEITIPQGTVRGINMVTRYNRTVHGYLGIPYAQPPIGNLRFRAPVSPVVGNRTFDASREPNLCPHYPEVDVFAGDEDCLYLNVFTPKLSKNESSTLLPIMVYLIGGAFITANSSLARFGPDYLLEKDVILVVSNYRLGVFGFLSTGDEVSPRNYGPKDMVRALEWTQENIKYFGGDPNQVTLFGGSSGGMSVHLLALSKSTEGLFHRCITQSGTAFGNELQVPRQVNAIRSIELGEYIGCPTNSSTLLVDCLRTMNPLQLSDTKCKWCQWKWFPQVLWLPTSEPNIEGAFLTDSPAKLYGAGKIRNIPWLFSLTRDEGFVRSVPYYNIPELFEEFLDSIDSVLPILVGYEYSVENVTAHTTALKSYYLNRHVLLNNITQLFGDAAFVYPTYKALKQQLELAKSPQYFCSFEYRGTFGYTYQFSSGSTEYTSISHGDELI